MHLRFLHFVMLIGALVVLPAPDAAAQVVNGGGLQEWQFTGGGDDTVCPTGHDDNIVWGTNYGTSCGNSDDDDNIVWGTAAENGDDNIVWGTGDADDNIVWGTAVESGDGNIVWGTSDGADNIVWGTSSRSKPPAARR